MLCLKICDEVGCRAQGLDSVSCARVQVLRPGAPNLASTSQARCGRAGKILGRFAEQSSRAATDGEKVRNYGKACWAKKEAGNAGKVAMKLREGTTPDPISKLALHVLLVLS